jgi:hypothetical protein
VVEAEGLDEFLVAARDVVRVAVRVQALQVRGDGGVLRRDCRPVLRVGFCYGFGPGGCLCCLDGGFLVRWERTSAG